jgi:hypothetical protein
VGVRHALFPRTLAFGAQAHPLGWVAGCQFPDAALICTDARRSFRLRSGAGPFPVSLPRACWARFLSSSVTTSADGRPPNPVWARLRIGRALTCFRRVGIANESRSLALRYGSYLLSLKLRRSSQAGELVFKPPRARILLRFRPRLPAWETAAGRSIRDGPFRLRFPGCDPGIFRRQVSRPKPPGSDPPHWLTVATSGLEPTVFPHTARNPGSAGVTWLAADFIGPHHFRSRVTDRSRSPPDSRYRMIEK